jgi:hypothetical protein
MSLSSEELSLKSEAVCQLICQATSEAGVAGGDARRESHIEFSCEALSGETAVLLERLISENSENWSEPYILITLIAISSRIMELSPHPSIKIRAAELLRKARSIACRWTEVIRKLLAEAYNAPDDDKLKLKFKLIDTAFVVASSFCVDAVHLDLEMDTSKDLLSWLSSLSVLYDEVLREFVGVDKSLSATKVVLLRRIINTGVYLESKIIPVVAHDQTVLSELTKKRRTAAKVFNSEWTKLEGRRRQVFECEDVVSEEESTHVVHIDVVLGKFLVDGCPVGKLPEEIVSTPEFQRVFVQIHDGVEKPCAFISRTLTPAEINYPTMQLELTAIAWCLSKLRSMNYGVPIRIYTDNCAACFILKSYKKQLSPKLSRIALTMMEYDIVGIHHVSGIKHDMIDCLSRFPTVDYTPDDDEIEQVPLLVIPSIDFAASQRSEPACLDIITGLTN